MEKYKNLFFLLVIIILISFFKKYFSAEFIDDTKKCNLNNDGFILLENILSSHQIRKFSKLAKTGHYKKIKKEIVNSKYINKRITEKLGDGYQFMDYVWMIMKSNVHTCHRDNNGLFFNSGQKHNSYTILFYLEDMDSCLDVIPKSHKNIYDNSISFTDETKRVKCSPGSAILFNANLVHTGSFNRKPNNMRIQMKISHKDDFEKISYYQNYNKYVDKENNIPEPIRKIQKHVTCQLPFLSDITQKTNIQTARGSSEGTKIPLSQKIFSLIAYGNPNYYDLPNAENFKNK
tara:strand:- start:1012 stop:1881 length:870 start_codon:yes stop_codon:yes gene_type:complete